MHATAPIPIPTRTRSIRDFGRFSESLDQSSKHADVEDPNPDISGDEEVLFGNDEYETGPPGAKGKVRRMSKHPGRTPPHQITVERSEPLTQTQPVSSKQSHSRCGICLDTVVPVASTPATGLPVNPAKPAIVMPWPSNHAYCLQCLSDHVREELQKAHGRLKLCWRCWRFIEPVEGHYCMTCICGNQFCHRCSAPWLPSGCARGELCTSTPRGTTFPQAPAQSC